GSFVHFYLIKKLLRPVHDLIEATKQLQKGDFPAPIKVDSEDEVGHLTEQFNRLISQLKVNEKERGKLINNISHEFRTPLSNLKDRKSTRLNSSHVSISYAVFCLK